MQTALSTIPMVITAVDSGVKAFGATKGAVETVNAALTFLAAKPFTFSKRFWRLHINNSCGCPQVIRA
ncbi:MAG: hypothetical protein QXL85_01345 [Candidatus Bathyarchaeia archaeon]